MTGLQQGLSEGTKPSNPKDSFGSKKAGLAFVPATVLLEVGVAMTEGALKYGPFNWREVGVRGSIYYDATIRHLTSWYEGEDTDPDSQLSHITKAITSLIVLRDSMIQGNYRDDRPPRTRFPLSWRMGLDQRVVELMEKYPQT